MAVSVPTGGYNPEHFASLFAAEDLHFWFGARNHALKTIISSLEDRLTPKPRALEIGCGTGNTLRMLREVLPNAQVIVGMDLFDEGLQFAKRRAAKALLVRGRIEAAPFRTQFDLIGMFDVLEHIHDDAMTLASVRMLLRDGGYLLLTVPAGKALWSRFDEESHHCRRYEPDELRALLTGAAMRIDYLTPFMASLYPLVRTSRWLSARKDAVRRRFHLPITAAVQSDLRVRPIVNQLVAFVLRRETCLLRKRKQLWAGTSLLAVARRE